MLWNNIIIALRNLRKNKAFAAINISGLALGLTIYIFGGLLVEYENTHDQSYANVNRIYTIGSTANPELNVGVDKFNSTFMAVAPIIKAELSDIDAVARTRNREYLLTSGAESYYEGLRFADPELLTIFDFNYIHGDSSALDDPSGLLITETIAIKYFGNTDAIGEVLTFDNEYDFSVTAVIEDPPLNTHFNSLVIADQSFGIVAPIRALNRLIDYDADVGDWNNLSLGDMTYVLLPENLDQAWLQSQADRIYDTLVPEDEGQAIASLDVHPLSYANVAIWDMIGMPVIVVISLLSLMVLIVACVNYTNLATAQSNHGCNADTATDSISCREPGDRCDCHDFRDRRAGDGDSTLQQCRRQKHDSRLHGDNALVVDDYRACRSFCRIIPGVANHPNEPNRSTSRHCSKG
jgi:putative ABC transport system permease protein